MKSQFKFAELDSKELERALFPVRHRKSASLPGKPLSKKKIQY